MKRTKWYDPSPDLPWLLPVPEGDRPDRELPPDRIQLTLIPHESIPHQSPPAHLRCD